MISKEGFWNCTQQGDPQKAWCNVVSNQAAAVTDSIDSRKIGAEGGI
jgi:hypothetical protein